MSDEFCPAHMHENCPKSNAEGTCEYCGYDFEEPHLTEASFALAKDAAWAVAKQKMEAENEREAQDLAAEKGKEENCEENLKTQPEFQGKGAAQADQSMDATDGNASQATKSDQVTKKLSPVAAKRKRAIEKLAQDREGVLSQARELANHIDEDSRFVNMVRDFDYMLSSPNPRARVLPELVRIGDFIHQGTGLTIPALFPIRKLPVAYKAPKEILLSMAKGLQLLAIRFIASLRSNQSQLILMDCQGEGACFGPLLSLDRQITGDVLTNAGQSHEIANGLVQIRQEIKDRIRRMQIAGHDSWAKLLESNQNVQANYILILLHGFPVGLNNSDIESLVRIAESGGPHGIHLALTWDRDANLQPFKSDLIEEMARRFGCIEAHGENRFELHCDRLIGCDTSSFRFDPDVRTLPPDKLGRMIRKANELLNRKKPPVTSASILEPTMESQAIEDLVSIPVGIDEHGHRIEYRISTDDHRGSRHSLVLGFTGQGKSSFLQTLILSGAWKYQPSQLQFYLLDLGGGTAFQYYQSLPHAKVVAATIEEQFSATVFQHLLAVISYRTRLFKKSGVQNIVAYRRTKNAESVATLIIIVDEFQNLLKGQEKRQTNLLMEKIAREGRKYGLFLVLATQTLAETDLSSATKNQIGTRILFKSNNNQDINAMIGAENEKFHGRLKAAGEGLYLHDFRSPPPSFFRAAYMDELEIEGRVSELSEHYADWAVGDYRMYFSESDSPPPESNPHLLNIQADDHLSVKLYLGQPDRLGDDIGLEHVSIRFERLKGHNAYILGGKGGGVTHLGVEVAIQLFSRYPGASLYVLDVNGDLIDAQAMATQAAADTGGQLVWCTNVDDAAIALSSLKNTNWPNERKGAPVLVFVADGRQFMAPDFTSYDGNSHDGLLNYFIINGPKNGVHVLLQVPSATDTGKLLVPGSEMLWKIYLANFGKGGVLTDDVLEENRGLLVFGEPKSPSIKSGFQMYGFLGGNC